MSKTLLFSFFILSTVCIFSQENAVITGNLSDENYDREPLLFATVKLKNTCRVTQTNFHGNFEFSDLAPGTYTLVYSFLGYDTKEVSIHVKNNDMLRVNHQLSQKNILHQPLTSEHVAADTSEKLKRKR
ncbi:carboxypeptidase-like regulatory domain-containing protein [Cellulophaga sp. Hel_I_12]|uniref:carboxypeptidase-like regulatory domain-containing protein n=1 Tax=Cellulophaga sp. Hel_I_12 TaxID=1249972 RepID=UPI00068DA8E7|nr:carboxypeptidase-like regulatory domain-containing protein [Cellulophaga sp. Hel_I_12]